MVEIDRSKCAKLDLKKQSLYGLTDPTNQHFKRRGSEKTTEFLQVLPKRVLMMIFLSILTVLLVILLILLQALAAVKEKGNFSYKTKSSELDQTSAETIKGEVDEIDAQFTSDIEESPELADKMDLVIVSRQEWDARFPIDIVQLDIPAELIIIAHTATQNCNITSVCSKLVKSIQKYHMVDRKWWDIGYNFLIGGDGKIYEGRGWMYEGAHTSGYNKQSIGIALIGNFDLAKPYQSQLKSCKDLIGRGVSMGFLKKDYKLFGASQLVATKSPGENVMQEIKKWHHFSIAVD